MVLDINDKDNYGCTVVHRMASEERTQLLAWVSEKQDVNIRVRNFNGITPMWLACKRGNIAIVKMLFKMGESLHDRAYENWSEGQSPYDAASTSKHEELAEMLRHRTMVRCVDGKKEVWSLKELAKETVRNKRAEERTNIWPKIQQLELPKALKAYLIEFV